MRLVNDNEAKALAAIYETQQEIVWMFRDEPKRRESRSPGVRASRRRCKPALYQFS